MIMVAAMARSLFRTRKHYLIVLPKMTRNLAISPFLQREAVRRQW
jgi:hypothetical protein